jgi:hypothetical protein
VVAFKIQFSQFGGRWLIPTTSPSRTQQNSVQLFRREDGELGSTGFSSRLVGYCGGEEANQKDIQPDIGQTKRITDRRARYEKRCHVRRINLSRFHWQWHPVQATTRNQRKNEKKLQSIEVHAMNGSFTFTLSYLMNCEQWY